MTLELISDNAKIFITTGGWRFDTYEAGVQGLSEEAKRKPWADLELRTFEGWLAAKYSGLPCGGRRCRGSRPLDSNHRYVVAGIAAPFKP